MCDERERLIGYVYDECDADERAQIQAHLETCADCRGEIGALRGVREDLLAWSVPEHAPIWRPAPAVMRGPWWRQSQGWGLAAAAAVVLLAGVAGGAATRVLMPPPQAPVSTGVTAQDLNAVEQQLVALMRSELARVRETAPAAVDASATGSAAVVARQELEARILARLDETDRRNLERVAQLWADFNLIKEASDKDVRKLRQGLEEVKLTLERQGGGQ